MDIVIPEEPQLDIEIDGRHVTILGTAHVSHASVKQVEQLLTRNQYDAVAIELCESRHGAITSPDALAKMDMFQVLREGKTPMVIANLALSAFQQKIAEDLGIEPGAELKTALKEAKKQGLAFILIDREIGTTLKRCYRNISWWKRFYLLVNLIGNIVSIEKIEQDEIEKLKQGDMMEAAFSHFAATQTDLFVPLIEERDLYMAFRLYQEIEKSDFKHVFAVVGAGHLKGISTHLKSCKRLTDTYIAGTLSRLDEIPKTSGWPKIVGWLVVAIILVGFAIGFNRNTEFGWQLVIDWIVINGGLSSLGALLAAAHPLTIITAFLAAPLTSLNPMIGAGVVTAGVELTLRKPSIGDFSQLRRDATQLKGWWKNRVARTMLVFLFSTVGSVLGTYIAGFRIFEQLT